MAAKVLIPRVILEKIFCTKNLSKSVTRDKLSLTEAMLFKTEKSRSQELSL